MFICHGKIFQRPKSGFLTLPNLHPCIVDKLDGDLTGFFSPLSSQLGVHYHLEAVCATVGLWAALVPNVVGP